MNLGGYLSRSSMYWPDLEALVCGDRRWSYRELEDSTNRLASALLGRGLAPGDAVATFAGNCGELVETEMALYKSGLLRVPINARLGAEEVAHILTDADVRMVFVDTAHAGSVLKAIERGGLDCAVVDYEGRADHHGTDQATARGHHPLGTATAERTASTSGYQDLLAEGSTAPIAVEVSEDDPAVLNFTSGSTGKLKAAVQTHGNRLANMRKRIMSPEGPPSCEERFLAPGPITHASGMAVLACLARGAKVVVLPEWDTGTFLATVEAERITSAFLVPTMLTMVLAHPDVTTRDLSSLRHIRVGGAPVPPQRLREAMATLGPVVMQGYGQGETTSGITIMTHEDMQRAVTSDPDLLMSCGRAWFDTEVRVVDENGVPQPAGVSGEVVARGPDCAREYWNEPELSAETFRNGWVHTGDIGYLRHDGYLFIVDRIKDMIISGGFNIYCSEVEAALYEHPAVLETCVVGVPDEHWGEAVKAVVVRRPGSDVTTDELIEFCAGRLARMKKPRSVDFAEHLPVNRNGKLDRRAVRAPYWADAARHVN
ncbi:acyl-CoA synthetase [Streptomyces albipurpureus]|uniref:Long-chain fatty acid--CoA ligase n=1 Tax=Streptomyces albipurpureus TaxID=2897419 RepID=A0ABT0UXV2_9ACTN|nr:long-chain fatty acid--CoA ligase [Streptomyces sp. CWNU-1]MCM2393397.1 long-chain fatty acid--CoA ligase [Streptomyces sp. CWNU-1]